MANETALPHIDEIRKAVPERIEDARGGHYDIDDADRRILYRIVLWSDEELEQNLFILSPLEDAANAEEEYKDLLRYLNMDGRVYAMMFGVATIEMARRNKDRTLLKRINPTKRKWRVPALE